jgi:hypothetical protein
MSYRDASRGVSRLPIPNPAIDAMPAARAATTATRMLNVKLMEVLNNHQIVP